MSFKLRCLLTFIVCLCLICLLGRNVHIINRKKSSFKVNLEAPKSNNSLSLQRQPIDWQTNIDIVILWSGPPKPHMNGTDVARERYNGELPYSLRAIALHAPWVRRILILVNTDSLPSETQFVPASMRNRTVFVDRCTYMPKGDIKQVRFMCQSCVAVKKAF